MKKCLAAAFLCLTSCGVFTYTDIYVEFPAPPPQWPEMFTGCRYVVRFLGAAGSVAEIETGPGAGGVFLRVPKLPVVPVSAAPLYGEPPAAVRPCGGVYPFHLDGEDTLRLTWDSGFLAEALLCSAGAGDSMLAVNVEKLEAEILEKSEGDPWRLDGDAIRAAIADETLSYRSLRLLPCLDVTIEAAAGSWTGGNPLSPVPVVTAGTTLFLPALPVGVHSYFLSGGAERIDISVTQRDWTAIRPVKGDGTGGSS